MSAVATGLMSLSSIYANEEVSRLERGFCVCLENVELESNQKRLCYGGRTIE